MKEFKIEIIEKLSESLNIKANSIDEALDKVNEMYKNEQIILDSSNHIDTEIREYKEDDSIDEINHLMQEIINYLIDDEKKHFEEFETTPDDHIYLKLKKLRKLIS